ncbi:MFS transporter [Planosporangium thailandense]|uniref:MFS transporter n=1 Tax=Planosporangium thailandense TaxID=765197 RepID=A0ABX0XSD1_9ACTN|nr:MFS transporter [Planosporangium thailandense]NJC68688.1 MFS transporter [Planosporangium thailandense]
MSFTSAPGAVGARRSGTAEPAPSGPRWRDVRIAALARGASVGGDLLAATALLLALQGRGEGGLAVAAVFVAASAPLALLAPLSGRLVDRVDSRLLLTVVGLAQAACCVGMAWAHSTAVLVTLVAVVAAGASVVQPTFAALLPEMVGRDHLPRAMAAMQAASSVGMLAGPPVAGLLLGAYGLRVPLLVDAATFVGISVAGMLIATRRGSPSRETAAARHTASWSLWRDPLLAPIVLMVGLVIVVVSGANVVEIFFVRQTLHASTVVYGLVGAVWTGFMVLGSWLVAHLRADDTGYALLTAGALGATSAVVAACGLVPNAGWLAVLYTFGGIGNGALNSTGGVLLSRRAPSAVRGRAFGYYGAVNSAASIGGFAAAGVLVERFTPATLLVASGSLGVLAVAVCLLPALRAVRRERARTAERPTVPTTA